MDKTVIIMAAGMGSRYGGLKQLDQVGPSGETIMDYSVYDAVKAGFSKIVFVIREEFHDIFREQIGSKFEKRVEVEYVFQKMENIPEGFSVPDGRTKPWGTGQAMLSASSVTKEPFIIINADDFYGFDAFQKCFNYLESVAPNELSAALCGYYVKNTLSANGTVSRGLCTVNDGKLSKIEETHGIYRNDCGSILSDTIKEIPEDTIVSMNIWAFSPIVFNYAEKYFKEFLSSHGVELKTEFYIPDIVNNLIRHESLEVSVINTRSEWFGVTYKEDKPEIIKAISEKVKNNEYPSDLWSCKD